MSNSIKLTNQSSTSNSNFGNSSKLSPDSPESKKIVKKNSGSFLKSFNQRHLPKPDKPSEGFFSSLFSRITVKTSKKDLNSTNVKTMASESDINMNIGPDSSISSSSISSSLKEAQSASRSQVEDVNDRLEEYERTGRLQAALNHFARLGDIGMVAAILKKYAEYPHFQHLYLKPLQIAAENNHSAIVECILNKIKLSDKYFSQAVLDVIKHAALAPHSQTLDFIRSFCIDNKIKISPETLIKFRKKSLKRNYLENAQVLKKWIDEILTDAFFMQTKDDKSAVLGLAGDWLTNHQLGLIPAINVYIQHNSDHDVIRYLVGCIKDLCDMDILNHRRLLPELEEAVLLNPNCSAILNPWIDSIKRHNERLKKLKVDLDNLEKPPKSDDKALLLLEADISSKIACYSGNLSLLRHLDLHSIDSKEDEEKPIRFSKSLLSKKLPEGSGPHDPIDEDETVFV